MKQDFGQKNLYTALCWYLGIEEAEEVISELNFSFVRNPWRYAKSLLTTKEYYTWLSVFLILCCCSMIYCYFTLRLFCLYIFDFEYQILVFLIGSVTSLVWLRRERTSKNMQNIPKPVTFAFLLFAAALFFAVLGMEYLIYVPQVRYTVPLGEQVIWIVVNVLRCSCLFLTVIRIVSACNIRTKSSQWAYIYIISSALMLLCTVFLFVTCDMVDRFSYDNHYLFVLAAAGGFIVCAVPCLWRMWPSPCRG